MTGVTPAPAGGRRRGVPTIGPVTAWILAHASEGLAGDGIPGALLYGGVVVGALVAALGLRARGTALLGGPAVPPLSIDGAEADPWPGDAMGRAGRTVGQVLGGGGLVLLLVVGWAGSDTFGLSPLSFTLLLLWWTVPLLSLLLGDWWRLVDPFDALAAAIERARPSPRPLTAAGDGTADGTEDEADEAGDWWVPALLLATFAWTVTCWLRGFEPRVLATWLSGLTVVMVVGTLLGGRAWARRSSPMAVLASTVAAAAPLDWSSGRPRPRSPLRGLAARAGGRRSTGVVVVVLGTVFWEAVGSTQWWAHLIGASAQEAGAAAMLWATAGWVGCLVLTATAWAGVATVAGVVARRSGSPALDRPFGLDAAATLAPVAGTALAAHQLGQALPYAQFVTRTWSDPFDIGWNLFGTADLRVEEQALSTGARAWTALGLIAVGLALLLTGAWDRLAARAGRAVLTAGWVVAGATAGLGSLALWLLLGA